LLNTFSNELPRNLPANASLITLDGSSDPIQAFDTLVDTGLEAIPVTTSQYHTHINDEIVIISSSHQQYPVLYKLAKESELQQQVSQFNSPAGNIGNTGNGSPSLTAQPSPKFSTPAKASQYDQVLVYNLTTNTVSFQASHNYQTPGSPGTSSSSSSSFDLTPARSLRETLQLVPTTTVSPLCTPDCAFRQGAGWLDIRDLASCIVYVYQQPINEDSLEFREGGHVEPSPFVINTRGLDGITDLPTLTQSSSYSSINSDLSQGSVSTNPDPIAVMSLPNTSSLHPTPEDASPIDSMGIVYEDDEAKEQGLELKKQLEKTPQIARFQGISHRLSLAPMVEEDDTFDLDGMNKPATPVKDVNTPSTPSSVRSSEDASSSTPELPRSRSQSRHRRKMITLDELSADLTEGGQQGWVNTLKSGLGKFASVGNISTAYLSRRHPLRTVKNTATLYEVFKLLSVTHAHRLVVVDEKTNKMTDIISHRTVIKWLFAHQDDFFQLAKPDAHRLDDNIITDGDETSEIDVVDMPKSTNNLLDKKIDDLTIGTRHLTQIRNDILGLDALQEMDEHSRTGLAVVDDCGRLIGATSARTIKKITHHRDHKTMSRPLLDFIETDEATVDNVEPDEGCMVSHGAVVLLDDDVTLRNVLSAMFKYNSNRVFLVDEDSYPTKVISLSDILQLILY